MQSPPHPLPDPTQTPVLMSDIGFCKWMLYWLLCCAFSCVLGVIVVCYFVILLGSFIYLVAFLLFLGEYVSVQIAIIRTESSLTLVKQL